MAPVEQDGKGTDLNKFLIISIASTIILCIVFAGVNYLFMESLLTKKISTIQVSSEELEEGEATEDEIQRGIIVEISHFFRFANSSLGKFSICTSIIAGFSIFAKKYYIFL